jgi:hypothetical protein
MALHLFQNFPEQFPSLNRLPPGLAVKLLTGYFKFHDAPKLWELEKLREFGFSGFEKPLESIRKNWGQTLPEADRGWIDSMNEVERVYKTAGLHRLCAELGLQLVSRLWRELLAIEDLVDVLDTKLNRTYEVTGSKAPPKPFAAEEYIRLVRKNIFGALLFLGKNALKSVLRCLTNLCIEPRRWSRFENVNSILVQFKKALG